MKMSCLKKLIQQPGLWAGLCLFILMLGCGADDIGQQVECTNNNDCVLPRTCNVIQGVCEHVREEPSRPTNPSETPGNGSDSGNSESDVEDVEGSEDSGLNVSDTSNSGFDTGSPDEDDTREPEEPEPEETMCQAINQECDLERPIQGDFVCIEGGGLGSICLKRCEKADHPSTCDDGFYCREHIVNGTAVLGCAAGGCVSNRDCDHIGVLGGNCMDQGNGYKKCVEGGTILEGQACQGEAADYCMEGTRCRITDRAADTGVCATLCNPWSPILTCLNSSYCEPFNPSQGVCNTNVVTNSVTYYFDTCRPVGAMCHNRAKCVGFDDGSTHCVPYCRVGANDCSDIRKPWGGFLGGSSSTSCQPRNLPGTEQISYCL